MHIFKNYLLIIYLVNAYINNIQFGDTLILWKLSGGINMYTDINSQNDEFNRMQEKIKDTIESIVANPHISNPICNSSAENSHTDEF